MSLIFLNVVGLIARDTFEIKSNYLQLANVDV